MKKIKKKIGKVYRDVLLFNDTLLQVIDKRKTGAKALVLLYHRVNNLPYDPLMLSVSPENFEEHLIILKKHFDIISTPELISRLSSNSLKGNELSITFDDGYKDNLTYELPIAEKYGIPITIFITTSILDENNQLPWDKDYKNHQAYLTTKDIETLSMNDLVTIGSHTLNHPRLRDLLKENQYFEMKKSKEVLQNITKKNIDIMAYPYGGHLDWNNGTLESAKLSGYKSAFTTIKRLITTNSNRFKLPRINIRNVSADELIEDLLNLIN